MKYRTSKRAERPWWRRVKRAWDRWVEDLTRVEPVVKLPSYAELKARAIPHTPRPGARREERR